MDLRISIRPDPSLPAYAGFFQSILIELEVIEDVMPLDRMERMSAACPATIGALNDVPDTIA